MSNNYSISTLFSSLGTSSSSGIYGSLSELASIRSGSYHKLAEKYYGNSKGTSSTTNTTEQNKKRVSSMEYDYKKGDYVKNLQSTATSTDKTSTIASTEKSAEALKKSADTLTSKGTKSVFTETNGKYDTGKIYNAVNEFAKNYNSLVDNTAKATSSQISTAVTSMRNTVTANSGLLSKIGITVGSDNKLTVNEDTFKKADMNKVKSLFNGNGSFAYQVGMNSSMIDYAAQNEAAKANTYNGFASYNNNYNQGNLFSQDI